MPSPSRVLVTGASSGLGAAFALACARPGATLFLGGRDAQRLGLVADAVRERGAEAAIALVDVRDGAATEAWVRGAAPLDLVLANAGISAGTGGGQAETAEQARAIFATNLDGALNTGLAAAAVMRGQAPGADGVRGRIGVVASIAAFVPAPGAPSYCASKAAVDAWAVATAPVWRREGIVLTSVCPGYVKTPMTASNRFPMPGLMEADRAAAIMLRGMLAGRQRLAFPGWLAVAARLVGLLPAPLATRMLGSQPGKEPAASP
ncbi:SDR family NAD(P)-dependent oxidoreductase [Elioraea rosea]|uniref:SDR family NAD(P)-dependent oxidoreductase n=1 Tax=Elioraea rosea TaxID=2492390 RepID=UPI001183B996|nr:SDR family NAD(P)-dependent oxidoreductase [Elioraea rosea]